MTAGPASVAERSPTVGGCPVFPPTTPGTPTSPLPRCAPNSAAIDRRDPGRSAPTTSTPTSARTRTTASRTSSSRRPAAGADHLRPRTATRATPARSRSRSTRRSRVGRQRRRSPRARGAAGHVRAVRAVRRAVAAVRAGRPRAGARFDLTLERAATRSAGRAPTPPGCRSCPGLVRYDEVAGGSIRPRDPGHVLADPARATSCRRRTSPRRRTDPDLPPMGLRLRLRADVRRRPAHRAGAGDRRRRCSGTD